VNRKSSDFLVFQHRDPISAAPDGYLELRDLQGIGSVVPGQREKFLLGDPRNPGAGNRRPRPFHYAIANGREEYPQDRRNQKCSSNIDHFHLLPIAQSDPLPRGMRQRRHADWMVFPDLWIHKMVSGKQSGVKLYRTAWQPRSATARAVGDRPDAKASPRLQASSRSSFRT